MFKAETSIGESKWRGRYWARWGDALNEAGFQPNDWTKKSGATEVMSGVIVACRHFGRLPTNSEIEILRQTNPEVPAPNVIRSNIGNRSDLIAALTIYVVKDKALSDISAMLPKQDSIKVKRQPSSEPIEGFVYLIRSGDFYKVGRSDNAERRFKEITVALPDKAVLFHAIRTDDPPGIEAYWHRRFADRRSNGEWFKLNSQDISAFKKRKFQ